MLANFGLMNQRLKSVYEIPFTRYFYKYEELRSFKDIMSEIEELEMKIQLEIKKVIG